MKIDSRTELYCIFGNPVRHSFSPLLHNSAFREIGLNAVYLAFEPKNIKEAIDSMKALGIKGASITIPFKIDSLKFVDEIDEVAADIGSINTLHNTNGRIKGYNTDGDGALAALKEKKIPIDKSSILVIGNGGSARAIAFTLLNNSAEITIAGRNADRIKVLANDLQKKYKDVKSILSSDLDKSFMEGIDIIINTTPVGMEPDIDSMPVDRDLILGRHTVFDIVYSPDTTKLLKTSEKKGCTTVRGINMLLNQGVKQFEIWTGKSAPIEVMYQAIYNHLNIKQ